MSTPDHFQTVSLPFFKAMLELELGMGGAATKIDDLAMNHAMRADGELITIVRAAGQMLIEFSINSDSGKDIAVTVGSIRKALVMACEQEGHADLAPQIWGLMVQGVLSAGYEKLISMMVDAQQKVSKVRVEQGRAAADKLAHELSQKACQHQENLCKVSAVVQCDGLAAATAIQVTLDNKAKAAGEKGVGTEWCSN